MPRWRSRVRAPSTAPYAGVAQWQSSSLPSWLRGSDSRHPLHLKGPMPASTVRLDGAFVMLGILFIPCGALLSQNAESLPLWGRWPSAARSDEVASMQASEPAVSNADGLRRLLGNSLGFMGRRWAAAQTCLGFHPKPRKGHRPLTRFRWRDAVELVQSAVSIADAGIRSETMASSVSFF